MSRPAATVAPKTEKTEARCQPKSSGGSRRDPDRDVEADGDSAEVVGSGYATEFVGDRQCDRVHDRAGVHAAARVEGVVELQRVGGRGIRERRGRGAQVGRRADEDSTPTGGCLPEKLAQLGQARRVHAAERHPDDVEQVGLQVGDRRVIQSAGRVLRRVPGERCAKVLFGHDAHCAAARLSAPRPAPPSTMSACGACARLHSESACGACARLHSASR